MRAIQEGQARAIATLAADAIEAENGSLDLETWGGHLPPSCETPTCIAGHLAFQARKMFSDILNDGSYTWELARYVLESAGVKSDDGDYDKVVTYDMFGDNPHDWPPPYAVQKFQGNEEVVPAMAVRMLRDIAAGRLDAFEPAWEEA